MVPPGGNTFTPHNGFLNHRYYSKEPNLNPGNVIYVFVDFFLIEDGRALAKEEDIIVTGNTWVAIHNGRVFDIHERSACEEFELKYPYMLNIEPKDEPYDPDKG